MIGAKSYKNIIKFMCFKDPLKIIAPTNCFFKESSLEGELLAPEFAHQPSSPKKKKKKKTSSL